MFTYIKEAFNPSEFFSNGHYIKQTCLGQGLGVLHLPRENAHLSLCSPLGHTLPGRQN